MMQLHRFYVTVRNFLFSKANREFLIFFIFFLSFFSFSYSFLLSRASSGY